MRQKKRINVSDYPHIYNLADREGLYTRLQEYLEWLSIKNYSKETVGMREKNVCWFLEWAGQRGLLRPAEITKPILERYQRHLFYYRKKNGEPLSMSNQSDRLVAVRHWFKWLARNNYLLYNPASDIELPKVPKRLPKAVLSIREAESVLNQADIHTPLGLRDRAILETFYSTGIRRSEMSHLKISDLDCDRGTLFIRQGKGKKDRMIPIGARAIQWIEKYLNEVRPDFSTGHDEGYLFLSRLGGRVGKNQLTNLARTYVNQANINKSGSCHLFRHTMATLMLENGADIRFIQAMLGHASLETTEVYTRVSIKKLKEIHTLTHPARPKRKNIHQNDEPLPEPTAEDVLAELAAEEEEDRE